MMQQVLKWEDIEVKEPGEGEVKVKHTAVGVNYIDVNYRNGAYKTSTPFIPGSFPLALYSSAILDHSFSFIYLFSFLLTICVSLLLLLDI